MCMQPMQLTSGMHAVYKCANLYKGYHNFAHGTDICIQITTNNALYCIGLSTQPFVLYYPYTTIYHVIPITYSYNTRIKLPKI